MVQVDRTMVVVLIAAALHLAGCVKSTPTAHDENAPAHSEKIEGSQLSRVLLTEKARARLDVHTARIREEPLDGSGRKTARSITPYSSVLYDTTGAAWVFTNPSPLAYVRHSVTVDGISGDNAFLTDGPAIDTEVVTVGVA